MNLSQLFLQLVAFDTHSDEASDACPSTGAQRQLGQFLVQTMRELGIADAAMDGFGYVYGSIPGNTPGAPAIGLLSHMDVSADAPSADIHPRLIPDYDGGDIVLNSQDPVILRPAEFPALARHKGKTLIVTDGRTLLGADDKAGIAEILAAAEFLVSTPLPHGPVKIAFTPDEEIGRGTDHFDLARFGADFAYTVDGGGLGELEYENFNAASAQVTIRGRNVHPGSARGTMVNAILLSGQYQALLPPYEIPACTDGYEGFYHLCQISGTVEQAQLTYLIRDHDAESFQLRKVRLQEAADHLNRLYGAGTVQVAIQDTYYNMKEKIQPCIEIVELAKDAMEELGIPPKIVPIRGGTDGARLSYDGLPCPNLCTGGENYHSRLEYIPLEDMEQVVRLLKQIILKAPAFLPRKI